MEDALGFDPSAILRINGVPQHAEAFLTRLEDGRLELVLVGNDGAEAVNVHVRGDFLDEFAARTREAAA